MHNLDTSIDGFQTAFATRSAPAWHGLGTVFDGELNSSQIMELAHMANWNVRLEPLSVDIRDNSGALMVVRDNPFDSAPEVMAVVGSRYKVFQNESMFALADDITGFEGRYETAGAIKSGRVVFTSLVMPDKIILDPSGAADEIQEYVLLTTSHDGSTAITAANTPIRVVCQNTLNVAMAGAKQSFKIRHTATAGARVAAAREALGLVHEYMAEFQAEAQKMIETEITKAQFDKIVAALYPVKSDSKAAMTRRDNKLDLIEAIYLGQADGPDTLFGIRGTAWGAFNALTEELDWYRIPRKGNAESTLAAASGFDPVSTGKRNEIRNAVMAMV